MISVPYVPFCFADHALVCRFRKVILARLGENVSYTCDLNPETPYWYDVKGQGITDSQLGHQVQINAFQTQLILINLTLKNAGVYFCNGTKYYGSLIIYVQGNVCNYLNTNEDGGMQQKEKYREGVPFTPIRFFSNV